MRDEEHSDMASHHLGAGRAEDLTSMGREPGRHDLERTHAGRPSGTSTLRDSTGINPERRKPIDPQMPTLIPA